MKKRKARKPQSVRQLVGKERWKKFSKPERRMLKDLAKAKRLVDRHLNGTYNEGIAFELYDVSRTLETILEGLEAT